MRQATQELKQALESAIGKPVLYVKGLFVAQDGQRYTITQARKITGLPAPERNFAPRIGAWGDYATIAMLNSSKR